MTVYKKGSKHRTLRGDAEFEIVKLAGVNEKTGEQIYMVKDPSKTRLRAMTGKELLQEIRPPKREGFVYFSASQVATAMRCMRKWAFEKIDKIVVPSTRDQTFGTDTHSVLEGFLDGKGWSEDPNQQDAVETAQQGVDELPEPGGDIDYTVEHYFEFEFLDGKAIMVGFIDLWIPLNGEGIPQVTDHKTTKDLRYAMGNDPTKKSKTQIKEDVQANLYGKFALDQCDADEVFLKWLYYCGRPNKETESGRPREPRGFRAVPLKRSREEIEAFWEIIVAKCQEMYDLKINNVPAKDCQPNTAACWDYGGCPHKNRCNVKASFMEPTSLVHSKKQTKKEKTEMKNLMNIIKNKKAGKTAEGKEPTDDINPPEVDSNVDVPDPEAEALAAKEAAAAEKAAAKAEKAAAKGKGKKRTKKEIEAEKAAKAAAKKPMSKAEKLKAQLAEAEAEEAAEVAAAEAAKAAEEAAEEAKAEAAKAAPKKTTKAKKSSGKSSMGGLVIFLDTFQVKGGLETVSLAEFTADFKAAIEEQYEVGYWNGLKFYQGEQHLGACLSQHLKEETINQVILCDSRSSEWKACGGVLLEKADLVIKGC